MLLSVIIVSYNEGRYISQAIESCLLQVGIDDYEIIIGDDGSSDNSLEILKEYQNKYPDKIKYFVMDRDETGGVIGAIRASNVIKAGLAIAKGKYINIMSADDFFCNNQKFLKSIELLEQDKDDKYAAVVSQYKKVWDNGDEEIVLNFPMPFKLFWSNGYIHISCFVFRSDVYRKKLLLPRFCDDIGLIFSIGLLGEFHYIDDVMFAYRQRSGSIMHASDKLELCILEILVLQDILNVNKEILSSLSRMRKYIVFLYKNKQALSDSKYLKYKTSANRYKNNVLKKLEKCNCVFFCFFKIVNAINSRIWGLRRSAHKRLKI